MEETSVSKSSSKSTKTLGSAMPSGNWKKVNLEEHWDVTDALWAKHFQAQKERLMSKLTANLDHLSESQPLTSSSPNSGFGKLQESRVKHAFDTVLKKTQESKDLGNLETPLSEDKDLAQTSCTANECSTKEPLIARSLKRAGSPGPSITKASKNTDSSLPHREPGSLRYLYSGASLDRVKLDSLSGSVLLAPLTGSRLTQVGLMDILEKKISYSMTSTAPCPTLPSYGSWIEPNFDWKVKGATLTSYLKGFSSPLTNNHQSGTMVLNVRWMPYSDESITSSTSCVETNELSQKDLHSQSSGMAGMTLPPVSE